MLTLVRSLVSNDLVSNVSFLYPHKPADFPEMEVEMEYWLTFLERETIVKEVYFYMVEMILKQNPQEIDKCIGKYICRPPDRESGGGRTKKTNDEPENGYENESDASD